MSLVPFDEKGNPIPKKDRVAVRKSPTGENMDELIKKQLAEQEKAEKEKK